MSNLAERMTVVMPTSPIRKHPSTDSIESAVLSIRKHIPGIPVLIQVDGMRKENDEFRERYEEYKKRLALKALEWGGNTRIVVFSEYRHQAEMMRETFRFIDTPLIFYQEHDWDIVDKPIEWEGICDAVESHDLNHIRLCRWEQVLEPHLHLMRPDMHTHGITVIPTVAWWGHPQVTDYDFFHRLIMQFRPGCRTLIEAYIYGVVANGDWDTYRCAIYKPPGEGMSRIWHTDGREKDPVFEPQF